MTDAQGRYRTLRDAGICPGCKGDPEPGRVRCRPCQSLCVPLTPEAKDGKRAVTRKNKRRYYYQRAGRGDCTQCGKPWRGETVECDRCRALKRERQRARRGCVRRNRCTFCHAAGHVRPRCEMRLEAERRRLLLELACSRRAA